MVAGNVVVGFDSLTEGTALDVDWGQPMGLDYGSRTDDSSTDNVEGTTLSSMGAFSAQYLSDQTPNLVGQATGMAARFLYGEDNKDSTLSRALGQAGQALRSGLAGGQGW